MSAPRHLAWMVLILLVASFLRLHALPQVPPGMTHDEADHGLDAWGVVQGERPIYFTVGYGREPLYDYSTALLMSFLGPTYLAGRLTTVFFSLILIAGSYAWVRRALGWRVALLTAAGLALGFWPLMTARQALRSETLPALFALAVALYWRGFETGDWRLETKKSATSSLQSPFLWSGLLLGLTFYTYIPSRALWLLFPALIGYLRLLRRPAPWRETLLMLGLAALVGLPLFVYLGANPGAEVRIDQLAQPLQQALRGDFAPLWANVRSGLGIFTIAGDSQWRYNIAGRPLLQPVTGALFYAGLIWSGWRVLVCLRRRPRAQHCHEAPGLFLALVWLLVGVAPALATGRDLSTTQAIGMQPVLYLFPAVALFAAARLMQRQFPRQKSPGRLLLWGAGLLLGLILLGSTWRDYFQRWATHPAVAVQYEAELVAIIEELEGAVGAGTAIGISTDAPGRFHDAATARLYANENRASIRWFDGRHSLLLPGEDSALLIFSAAAPVHDALSPYLDALQATPAALTTAPVSYRVTHTPARLLQLYPQFSTEINTLSTELSTNPVGFGDVVQLLAYALSNTKVSPGDRLHLATVWEIQQAPDDDEDLVFFSHVLGPDGAPLAQADRLDAPVHSWQAGDILIQRHELSLPPDLPAGDYELTAGIYEASDWRRRLPATINGELVGDVVALATLKVTP